MTIQNLGTPAMGKASTDAPTFASWATFVASSPSDGDQGLIDGVLVVWSNIHGGPVPAWAHGDNKKSVPLCFNVSSLTGADGAAVDSIPNIGSAGGVFAKNTTAPTQTTTNKNGRGNALRFNGIDAFLVASVLGNAYRDSPEITIACVARFDDTSNNQTLGFVGDNTKSIAQLLSLGTAIAGGGRENYSDSFASTSASLGVKAASWQVYTTTLKYSSADAFIWSGVWTEGGELNRTESFHNAGNTEDTAATKATVGANPNGLNPFQGLISEIWFVDAVLTDADRAALVYCLENLNA